MSTANQIDANRANSQLSTGPISAEGKQTSSQNALKHGLTAQNPVLPTEDPTDYQRHVAKYLAENRPHGENETNLVKSLADLSWRQNRVETIELALIADTQDLVALVKALSNLSLHSTRLARQSERTLAQLQTLQNARREQEALDLDRLLNIKYMQEDKGEPFHPTELGFVFSDEQIQSALQARIRESIALEAFSYRD